MCWHTRSIAGSVPDHHNKASITIKHMVILLVEDLAFNLLKKKKTNTCKAQ